MRPLKNHLFAFLTEQHLAFFAENEEGQRIFMPLSGELVTGLNFILDEEDKPKNVLFTEKLAKQVSEPKKAVNNLVYSAEKVLPKGEKKHCDLLRPLFREAKETFWRKYPEVKEIPIVLVLSEELRGNLLKSYETIFQMLSEEGFLPVTLFTFTFHTLEEVFFWYRKGRGDKNLILVHLLGQHVVGARPSREPIVQLLEHEMVYEAFAGSGMSYAKAWLPGEKEQNSTAFKKKKEVIAEGLWRKADQRNFAADLAFGKEDKIKIFVMNRKLIEHFPELLMQFSKHTEKAVYSVEESFRRLAEGLATLVLEDAHVFLQELQTEEIDLSSERAEEIISKRYYFPSTCTKALFEQWRVMFSTELKEKLESLRFENIWFQEDLQQYFGEHYLKSWWKKQTSDKKAFIVSREKLLSFTENGKIYFRNKDLVGYVTTRDLSLEAALRLLQKKLNIEILHYDFESLKLKILHYAKEGVIQEKTLHRIARDYECPPEDLTEILQQLGVDATANAIYKPMRRMKRFYYFSWLLFLVVLSISLVTFYRVEIFNYFEEKHFFETPQEAVPPSMFLPGMYRGRVVVYGAARSARLHITPDMDKIVLQTAEKKEYAILLLDKERNEIQLENGDLIKFEYQKRIVILEWHFGQEKFTFTKYQF